MEIKKIHILWIYSIIVYCIFFLILSLKLNIDLIIFLFILSTVAGFINVIMMVVTKSKKHRNISIILFWIFSLEILFLGLQYVWY